MAELDIQDQIARGYRAATELRETEAAFAAVEAALVKTLAATPVGADNKILKLHMSIQNLAAVREALIKTIANGKHGEYAREAEDAIAEAGLTRP